MKVERVARVCAKNGGRSQHKWEIHKALKVVEAMEPRVIMEVGSFTGWSLWAWSQVVAPGATIISVDLPYKNRPGTDYDTDPERLEQFGDHEMHFIRANSTLQSTKDKVMEALKGRAVDFLFIDGGHDYETVKSDYDMYGPLVPNGVVGFHDIAHPHQRCGVPDLWKEIRDKYMSKEYVVERGRKTQGIGMLFRHSD